MAMAPEIHEFEAGSKHCAKNSRSVAHDRQDAAPFGHGRCATAAKERASYALIGRAHALGMASACAPVCTENLSSGVVVVKAAKDGV